MFYFPTCQNETISGEDENADRLKQKFLKKQWNKNRQVISVTHQKQLLYSHKLLFISKNNHKVFKTLNDWQSYILNKFDKSKKIPLI